MPDGKITFATDIDNEKSVKKLDDLVKKIESAEKELFDKKEQQSAIKTELEDAKNEAKKTEEAISDLNAQISEMESVRDNFGIKQPVGLSEAQASLKEQEAILTSQNREVERLDGKYTKITDSVMKSTDSLNSMKAQATEISEQIEMASRNQSAFGDAVKATNKKFDSLMSRVSRLASRVFVFSMITSGLRMIREFMGKALQTNAEYTAQLAKLKGALLTAFQPIYEFALPGLLAVLRVLTSIVQVVANVLSFFSGKSASQNAKNAEALNKQAKAIGGVGSAAKEAKKQLMGFDEINKLDSTDTGAGSGGSGSGGGTITPDFSDFDTDEYKKKIDRLTAYLSGALLALGAILAFSGVNIPLGIALMAAGAMGLVSVVAENWNAIEELLSGALGGIIALVSPFMLALGAVLAFSGANIPLGIGLMIAGLAGMALTRNVSWGVMSQEIKNEVTDIMSILGGSLLILGVILAFSGANIPIGIAMIAMGATALVTAASLNWDAMKEELQGPVGGVTALISGALLAVGAVLAFTGVALPLGIALIALGAVGLAGTAAINWNTIQDALRGPLGGVVALVSAFLLVLGVVLCFTGVALPLGIALIAAGAVGLVSVAALNWNAMLDKLKEVWSGIKQWFGSTVAPYLTLSYWEDKFSAIGDGLKQSVKNGVNCAIDRFNEFISWINSAMSFSWGDVSLFGNTVIPAGSMQLLSIQHIPHLAQGAVIPPNRKFMAVLGDQTSGNNIEAPESLIRKIVREETRGMSSRRVEELLERLISTVEGIEIGDETIGRAAARYDKVASRARGY